MNLNFSRIQDATTGILDKTPRISMIVNECVRVVVAQQKPDKGFNAGSISAFPLRKLDDNQKNTMKALGVSNPQDSLHEYDVPAELQQRFYNHLLSVGAPLSE